MSGQGSLTDPHGKGERAVRFVRNLRLHEGKLAGKRFPVQPWQETIIRRIYGNTDEDGNRVVSTVFILLPRGNGKTTLASALALLHLLGPEKDAAGQVVCAASDREQSSIAYKAAKAMVAQDRKLCSITKTLDSKKLIKHPGSGSELKAISHESYTKHGMSVSFLIADELHAWPPGELYGVLTESMGKRSSPLTIVITTSGTGQIGQAYHLYSYAKKVAVGEIDDPSFLPILFEADADEDWQDEAVWRRVNPALDAGFRSIDEMRRKAKAAEHLPAERDRFRQFYLNVWLDGSVAPWLDMTIYDEGGEPFDLTDFEGEQCWIGVDLSSVEDLTAVVAVFPSADRYFVHCEFFLPESGLRQRSTRRDVPYQVWSDEGWLTTTPGDVVDYSVVEGRIEDLCERFDVVEIAIDRWNSTATQNRLMEAGLPVVQFGQGFASMSPAVRELQRAVLAKSFIHGGNPILRWNFKNIAIKSDDAGNQKFSKDRSAEKIDGAVAAAMAVGRIVAGERTASPYESGERSGFLIV